MPLEAVLLSSGLPSQGTPERQDSSAGAKTGRAGMSVTCACGNAVEPPRMKHCSTKCCNRAACRKFQARPGNKAKLAGYRAKYLATPKGIATRRAWESSPARKAQARAYAHSDHGRAVRGAAASRRRVAIDGRVCIGCGRTDRDTNWSRRLSCCQACDRTASPDRNGRCPCGSPLWKGFGVGARDRPLSCRANCGAS